MNIVLPLPRTSKRFTLPTGLALLLALSLGLLIAPAAASPAAAQSPCGAGVTLEGGESLLGIAARCGVTLPALLAANPGVRDDEDLEAGGRLDIPSPSDRQPTPFEACGSSYRIRSGDSLAEVAEKCGLTVPLLVAANGPLPNPLGLAAGAMIRIPDVPRRVAADTETLALGPRLSASAAPGVDEGAARPPSPDLLRVEGTLVETEPCPRVRTDDGATYTVEGDIAGSFRTGDRVVVLGLPLEGEACGAAPALELRILYRARRP